MTNRLTHIPLHIVEQFMAIVRRSAALERTPWHFGTTETLYRSEMCLLELVGGNEGIGVTEAAQQLGITKGAVSQTLKKLDKKGLVEKRPDAGNRLKASICLTHKGKSAYEAHMHWHKTIDGKFRDHFHHLNDEKLAVLSEFLKQYNRFLDQWEAMLER